jgi:uncharacterized membrane protein YphA (DoxX/SURF4 family)
MYLKLINVIRILLGAQLVINGLNWWVKLIDAYPSISDFTGGMSRPGTSMFMQGMIDTHVIFHAVKAVELISGVLLLANVMVPFALVFGYAVCIVAGMVDVFLSTKLRAFIMGTGIFFNTSYLMLAHFSYYRSMLTVRTKPDSVSGWSSGVDSDPGNYAWMRGPLIGRLKLALSGVALLYGVVMVTWLLVMVVQHLLKR